MKLAGIFCMLILHYALFSPMVIVAWVCEGIANGLYWLHEKTAPPKPNTK